MHNTNFTISDTDEYRARDLGLCSALYTTPGIKLIRLQRDSVDKFIWFIFSNRPLCEQTAQLYWFDSLAISNAKAFNDARKQLMDRLHANYWYLICKSKQSDKLFQPKPLLFQQLIVWGYQKTLIGNSESWLTIWLIDFLSREPSKNRKQPFLSNNYSSQRYWYDRLS